MNKINFAKLNINAIANMIAALLPWVIPALPVAARAELAVVLGTVTGIISALDTVVGIPAPAPVVGTAEPARVVPVNTVSK